MSKFNPIIVTSEIDQNYFIINKGTFYITYLATILSKKNIGVANMVLPAITSDELKKNKMFILKNSEIGRELISLINSGELVDEKDMIREEYVLNALVAAVMEDDDQNYVDLASKLIKEKAFDTIDSLKNLYDEKLLRKINNNGRKFDYTSKNELTGFEKNGVTYYNDEWYYFDVTSKNVKPIEEVIKKKTRS